jgi:2-haloacid dehalogenase
LNRVWHRLTPWPDSVAGLQRLKLRFVISTLSNGNISLLTNMAKSAGLPWDCILSAENVRRYKPDPSVYLLAPQLFDLKPDQVMMVAAHEHDLQAASKHGLRTAYVHRPMEHGLGSDGSTTKGPLRHRRRRFSRPGRSTLPKRRSLP